MSSGALHSAAEKKTVPLYSLTVNFILFTSTTTMHHACN